MDRDHEGPGHIGFHLFACIFGRAGVVVKISSAGRGILAGPEECAFPPAGEAQGLRNGRYNATSHHLAGTLGPHR